MSKAIFQYLLSITVIALLVVPSVAQDKSATKRLDPVRVGGVDDKNGGAVTGIVRFKGQKPEPKPFEAPPVTERLERAFSVRPANADAPMCYQCGVQMNRAGSCHACPSCGTTSGCS